MISQQDLFSQHVYVPNHAPETSAQAAAAVKPKTPSQRQRVLAAIRAAGSRGLTDEQIVEQVGLGPNSGRPRRKELQEMGLVRDSGLRRRTVSGAEAAVWIAA